MDTTSDNSEVQCETMDPKVELVLYRPLFGDTIDFASIFYNNAIIDAKLFNNRVIITDSRSFTLGKDNHFLQFLTTLPGTCTIIDFVDKAPSQDASNFILGDCKYLAIEDAILQHDIDTLIEKSIENKSWDQVVNSVKAMLFLFETNFIVSDFECRFVDSGITDIRDRLDTLASNNSKDFLLKFSGEQFQMYGNLSGDALYQKGTFDKDSVASIYHNNQLTHTILDIFKHTTKGIAHKNSAIIPTVQSFELSDNRCQSFKVAGNRALRVIADYNKLHMAYKREKLRMNRK